MLRDACPNQTISLWPRAGTMNPLARTGANMEQIKFDSPKEIQSRVNEQME